MMRIYLKNGENDIKKFAEKYTIVSVANEKLEFEFFSIDVRDFYIYVDDNVDDKVERIEKIINFIKREGIETTKIILSDSYFYFKKKISSKEGLKKLEDIIKESKIINKLLLKNVKINRFETYSNTIILDCELDFDNFLMLFDFVKKILKEVEKIAMVEVI